MELRLGSTGSRLGWRTYSTPTSCSLVIGKKVEGGLKAPASPGKTCLRCGRSAYAVSGHVVLGPGDHSKDVLEETYDLWNYFDEKRDALERLENYLLQLRDNESAGVAGEVKQARSTRRRAPSGAAGSRNVSAHRATH